MSFAVNIVAIETNGNIEISRLIRGAPYAEKYSR
jgi:hypothetical protein